MKVFRKLVVFILVTTMVLSASFAFATTTPTSKLSTVTFDKNYYNLSLNETVKPGLLTLDGKKIAIKSLQIINGADIIKVETGNVIKPLKIGYASIRATATNGQKVETSVIVYEGLVLDPYKIALTVGETYKLNPVSKNLKPIVSPLTYSIYDTAIASVDADGLITAISPGLTDVTVSNGQDVIMIKIGVFAEGDLAKDSFISLDKLTLQLYNTYLQAGSLLEASTTKPAYPLFMDDNQSVQVSQLKMTSSDPSILSIVNKGYDYNTIYAKKAGNAKLTVTANGQTKVFPITVKAEPKIKSVKIIKKDSNFNIVTWEKIKVGLDMFLTLQVTYVDGTTRELMGSYEGVTWKSSNTAVGIVSEHLFQGQKVGDVTVTATYKGSKASFKIKVVSGVH